MEKRKLKTIFSPRKVIVWIFIIIIGLTAPNINIAAMSQTAAIVTVMAIDKDGDKLNIVVSVLKPSSGKEMTEEIYQAKGDTVSQTLDVISRNLGKKLGFAQCEILGLGDSLCEELVMPELDYMTRTKQVGRNISLVNCSGDIKDFVTAVVTLNQDKSLKLDQILYFDRRYILTKYSSLETFYKGYFSETSLAMLPQVKISDQETDNAIEVSTNGEEESSGSSSSGGSAEKKKYFINDGTTIIFRKGKKAFELKPEDTEKLNYFINDDMRGTIKIEHINDDFYEDATVALNIVSKKTGTFISFKDGVPIYNTHVELTIMIEEYIVADAGKKAIKRSQEMFTPTLVDMIKEKITDEMMGAVELLRDKEADLLFIYRDFNRLHHKKWKEYLKTTSMEKFLDGIRFDINIDIFTEY